MHLVGCDKAGPWVLLARGLCGDAVIAHRGGLKQFPLREGADDQRRNDAAGWTQIRRLPGLAALAAPGELYVHNHRGTGSGRWLQAVYEAAGAKDKLQRDSEKAADEKVVEWLLR